MTFYLTFHWGSCAGFGHVRTLSDLPTSCHDCGRLKADIYWWSLVLKKGEQVEPLSCNIMSPKAAAQRACIIVTVPGLNV